MMRSFLTAVTAICALSCSLLAQPGPQQDRVDVIIGFNHQPGPSEEALVHAAGGALKHTYRIIPAIAAALPQRAVQALSNNPTVSVIEPDMELHALDEYSSVWGVTKIGAPAVHAAGNTGAAVKVCIIDSGIDLSHPELAARYAGGYDFVNNRTVPMDDNGHGTHVAGTVAASLGNGGIAGVAPGAGILAYKILDANGSGSFSNAIAALDACKQAGGQVTNNSYGSSSDPGTQVRAAFDNAYNAGILNVAAAGNATAFTCRSVSYPAKYDSVVAVAATDQNNKVASWSCRGAEVELAAPGVNITSTYLNSSYAVMSGTSMASPHVAGLAALVFNCGVTRNVDVRLRMQQTALDLGTAGRDSSYGFGLVQADMAAMNCNVPPPAGQPPAAPTNLSVTATGRNYANIVWSDNSDNETSFELWRCKGASCTNFDLVATVSANTEAYTNSGLSKNTTYRYEVRAVNATGASTFSNIASATTTR